MRRRGMLKRAFDTAVGSLTVCVLGVLHRVPEKRLASAFGYAMRAVGPWLPEHRVGRANLEAAYPEKSAAEIDRILRAVWFNLGQQGAEYVHFDTLCEFDPQRPEAGRLEVSPETVETAQRILASGKPALLFTAHVGNWELCSVVATALGLDMINLYRPPNNARVDAALRSRRTGKMGALVPTNRNAVPTILQAMSEGRSVGMVVDQHFSQGVDITFFGRPCKANATLARLARRVDCLIYGARIVRLPNDRFRMDVSPEIVPPRDAEGKIDVQATTQKINDVIEQWVREYPEQWLWLHRRWR